MQLRLPKAFELQVPDGQRPRTATSKYSGDEAIRKGEQKGNAERDEVKMKFDNLLRVRCGCKVGDTLADTQ